MKKEKDKRKKSRRRTALSWTAALLTLAVTTSALILPALTMTTEDNVVIESSEGSATVEGENEAAAADTAADVQTGTAEAAKDTGEETAQENVTAEEKSSESKSETSASGESRTESGTSPESKSEPTAATAESTASSPQSTAESGAESIPEGIDVTGTMEPAGKVTIPVMDTDETGEIDDTDPTTFLTVEYGDDTLPVGASIKARMMNPEETLYSSYKSEALKAVDEVNKEVALLFDVTITDLEGNVVEPANPVTVKVMLDNGLDEDKTYYAVHFTRELEENDPDEEDGGNKTKASLFQKIENKLHLTEEKTEPLCQILPVEQEDNELTFTADSFSPYAIVEVTEAVPVKKAMAAPASAEQGSILNTSDTTYDTNAANAWQVVDREYSGNAPENKTVYGNDSYQAVRVQKNVIPTGTENEFYVYLSVDTKLLMSEYLRYAQYQATTSNNYHSEELGTVVEAMTGNQKVGVSGDVSSGYPNSANFTIQDSEGKVIAENVKLYWSQANNVTFYLKTSTGKYILMGITVRKNTSNTVRLSSEAEQYIYEDVMKLISLDSVTDTMGDYIEYLGPVAGDYSTGPTFDKSTGTLTWIPAMKLNPQENTTQNGSAITTWSLNVAELVYKVRLKVQKDGFNSCASNMSSAVNDKESYEVNQSAVLDYSTKVGSQTNGATATFQQPHVRGLLYDYRIKKVEKDKDGNEIPLSGAKFSFAGTGNSNVTYNLTGTSGDDGMVSWSHGANSSSSQGTAANTPGVAWGTYTVRETKAPNGYQMSDDWKSGKSVTLCYTTDSSILTANGTHMIYKEGKNFYATVTNTKIPVTPVRIIKADAANHEKLLSGAEFKITKSEAETDSEWKDGKTWTSVDGGILFNGNLPYGTYTLTEDTAPDGYNKLSENVTIAVTKDGATYAQTDNNSGGTTRASLLDATKPASTDNPYVVYIYDNPGVELPSTGGFGKLPYTLGGMMLLAASALMYSFRKRRGERRIK